MALYLVPKEEPDRGQEDAYNALAEAMAVVDKLRRFVQECRDDPGSIRQLTSVDLAQAKALLAEARAGLAGVRRRLS